MIFLSAGHKTTGAVAKDGTTERSIVVSVAKKIREMSEGITFIGVSKNMTIRQKTNKINSICKKENLTWQNSWLVELHCDWSGAREGTGGYYYRGSEESKNFLHTLLEEASKVGDREILYEKEDSSSRFGKLGIIKDTTPLACLVELDSLRANGDKNNGLELLKSEEGQKSLAKAIIRGLETATGKSLLREEKEQENANNEDVLEELSKIWEKLENKKAHLSEIQKDVHFLAEKIRNQSE